MRLWYEIFDDFPRIQTLKEIEEYFEEINNKRIEEKLKAEEERKARKEAAKQQ